MAATAEPLRAVPLTRLDDADPALVEELLAVVERLSRRSAWIGGEELDAFEAEWAACCGATHAVGLASGTEALALGLRALEIGPGDEVIVPTNSFIASAEAVTLVGAIPRFVDVDPETALVTAELVAPAIGKRTRAIIPVHLYGRTVDLEPIMRLARASGLAVLEDACQAHGAWIGALRAGAVGDCGAFSFYPAKNLGAWGDAGALVTNDAAIADRVRLLRSHGERPRYHHRIPGTTARMDALQAGVLRVKLRRLEAANERRREIAAALTTALTGARVGTPPSAGPGGDHVYHQYVVTSGERDALRAHLASYGIATGIHYPTPIHRSGAYMPGDGPLVSLPAAERLADSILSLPMYPLLSADEVAHVASAVHAFGGVAGRA